MRRPRLFTLLPLAVVTVTLSTQAVFLLGASFFQIGPEFGIGPLGLGLLTASFFLTAAATSAPLGRWVQRVGWQASMIWNLRISALMLVLIPALAEGPVSFGILLVFAAAVYGASNPAANQALADHTDPMRLATIFGAKHAGIPASTLLAGLAVPLVVDRHGWRWAFVIAAVLAVGASFLVPRRQMPAPVASMDSDRPEAPPTPARDLLLLAVGSSFATWGAIALGTYLVTATVELGFSAAAAGTLQFVGSGVSIAARIAAGVITDRTKSRGFTGIVALASVGALTFALLPWSSGTSYVALVVVAFATGWGWPGLMTYTVVRANRASAASASAITQAGVFVGAGGVPIVLGAVIERWSFDGAWLTAAA
ncbi:MAG: MFS transporter, partial [Acidimicrobiia bacterium]|nr:MFS transporter [Acidimicrobiia bacterium]